MLRYMYLYFTKFVLHQQNSGTTLALLTRPSYNVRETGVDDFMREKLSANEITICITFYQQNTKPVD